MKSFLKYTLATIVGIIISSIILFFIFLGIVGAIVSSTEKEVVVKENSILRIDLSNPVPERSSNNPFENINLLNIKPSYTLGLNDILKDIAKAKDDPDIKGIYLDLGYVPARFATIEEIRNALIDFKKSRKFIISYAEYYTHNSYYLATVSDSIFIHPLGGISFVGLSSQPMFYKGTLKKLEIEPEVIRHGKFKSAVEPYTNDKMSPENREQVSLLLNTVWDYVLQGISERRKIDVAKLNELADKMTLSNAQTTLDEHMVDGIRYKDEILARLSEMSGKESSDKPEFVSLSDYNKAPKKSGSYSKDKIAVVYADGEIIMGDGDENQVGSEKLSKAIRDARSDSSIKAIVLRINSPGGSALASEIIWRELYLASKVKPLIVSMGSLAASGGYYIATPADTIVAEPTTITGSIGVFGILINMQKFLNDKLGITTDVVKTNKHSDIGTPYRPLTDDERAIVQSEIENIYDVFLIRVSNGRHIPKAQVDSIGQGRVWSAFDAKKLHLIDLIGGVDQAIEIAAKKAKLTEYRITELPKLEDPFTAFISSLSVKVKSSVIKDELGESSAIYYKLKDLTEQQGILARMPFDINLN